jgi:hypothetical protein
MAAVPYFEGWTGDEDYNPIEAFTGATYSNTLPGEFDALSSLSISGSGDSTVTDLYMVGASDLAYEFDIYLVVNPIPNYSKVVVTWPTTWILDCDDTFTVYCSVGCDFKNDTALKCDEPSNSIELYDGFDVLGDTPFLFAGL